MKRILTALLAAGLPLLAFGYPAPASNLQVARDTGNVQATDGQPLTFLNFPGRITLTTTSSLAGLNVGSFTADPATLINGDIWYNSSENALNARINGATISLGSGGGGGGVNSFSFVNANGIAGVVTNPTTAPALTLSLGAITPTSINGNTILGGSGTLNLNGATLNAGTGGTLGSGAFTSAYTLPTASTSVLGGVKVDGSTITINGSGVISSSGGGGGGSPGGLTTQMQYNNAGVFGGTTGLTWNNSTGQLSSVQNVNNFLTGFLFQNSANSSQPAAVAAVQIQNNAHSLNLQMTGQGYTGAVLSGGPTGESGSLSTSGAQPLILGTNNAANVIISSGGATAFTSTVTVNPFTTAGIVANSTAGLLSSLSNASSVSATLEGILGSGWSNSSTLFLAANGSWLTPAGSGGTPGGGNTQIQYNNSGSFAGSANLSWNGTALVTTGIAASGDVGIGASGISGNVGLYVTPAFTTTNATIQTGSIWTPSGNSQTMNTAYLMSTLATGTNTGLTYTDLYLPTPTTTGSLLGTSYQLYIQQGPAFTTHYGLYQAGTDSNVLGGSLAIAGTTSTTGAIITPANALGALVINVADLHNTKSISAPQTFTFSGTPANSNQWFRMQLADTGSAGTDTVTIPSSFSVGQQATITTFSMPSPGTVTLTWLYDGSKYNLYGEPQPTIGSGSYVQVTDANSSVLVTNSSGVPSLATALPTGVTVTAPALTTAGEVSGLVGYMNIPQNSQSAAYTFVISDEGKHILHPTADNNARTYTIDSNANVPWPIGTAITIVNQINTVTIAITSDTLTWYQGSGTGSTGSRSLAAGGVCTILKIGTTSWIIYGPGVS